METGKKYLEDDALTQKKSKIFNTLSNPQFLKIVLSTRTFENNENDLETKYVSETSIPSKYSLVTIDDISSHHKRINESIDIDSFTLKVVNEYQQQLKLE